MNKYQKSPMICVNWENQEFLGPVNLKLMLENLI